MTKRPLTHGQKRALTFLKTYFAQHDTFPTRREMAKAMNLSLTRTQNLMDGLVKAKAIYRLPGRANSLNGSNRLSFEPFDQETVLLETPRKPIKKEMAKVTVFLDAESKFKSYKYEGLVQVLIKRS